MKKINRQASIKRGQMMERLGQICPIKLQQSKPPIAPMDFFAMRQVNYSLNITESCLETVTSNESLFDLENFEI